MVTIREVAKKANVSVATVSRVINGSTIVSGLTKKKVEAVIKELNYYPNDVARSLFKGKSKMIALFIPDITNPYFPEIARAVEDITNKHGYTFILCNTDNDVKKEKKYLQNLRQKSIDGIIMMSNTLDDSHFRDLNIPIVLLDRAFSADYSTVSVNNYEEAIKAVNHLKNIGCKRIVHVAGPLHVNNAIERSRGYEDSVKEENFMTEPLIIYGDFNIEIAKKVTMELLTKDKEIDGIFVANDLMAIGVIQAITEMDLKVPENISVIGFDGVLLSEIITPKLTTIAQPIYDLGENAARMIIDKLENNSTDITHSQYEATLVIRESTRKG